MSQPLYLLRHGPTAASRGGAPLGRLDLPVEAGGQVRWLAVKEELKDLGPGLIATSDRARAREHALDLGAALGVPVRVLPALAEQDFGAWDGVPWSEIGGAGAFFADPIHTAPPGGESFAGCAGRTRGAFAALPQDQPLLILAHGGSLRAILAGLLGLPLERALDLAWEPFGLSRVDRYDRERGVLRFHNRRLGLDPDAPLAGGEP